MQPRAGDETAVGFDLRDSAVTHGRRDYPFQSGNVEQGDDNFPLHGNLIWTNLPFYNHHGRWPDQRRLRMTDFVAGLLKNEHPERLKGLRVKQSFQVIRSHTDFSRQNLLRRRGSYRGAEEFNSVNVTERQALDGVADR